MSSINIDMTIDDMPTWCTPACPPLSSDLSQRHKVHPSLRSGCAWSTKTGHTVEHLRCQLMWLVRVPPGLRLGQTRETLHPVKHLRCPPVRTVRVHWAYACAPDQRDSSPGEATAVPTAMWKVTRGQRTVVRLPGELRLRADARQSTNSMPSGMPNP